MTIATEIVQAYPQRSLISVLLYLMVQIVLDANDKCFLAEANYFVEILFGIQMNCWINFFAKHQQHSQCIADKCYLVRMVLYWRRCYEVGYVGKMSQFFFSSENIYVDEEQTFFVVSRAVPLNILSVLCLAYPHSVFFNDSMLFWKLETRLILSILEHWFKHLS